MNKMRFFVALMGISTVMSACGQKTDTVTTEVPSTALETTSAETLAKEPAAADHSQIYDMIHGTVLSVDEGSSTFTLKVDSGEELSVSYTEPYVETAGPIETDYRVTVIRKIEGLTPVLVLDEDSNIKIESVLGSIVDQAMSAFTVLTEDQKEISFLKTNFEGSEVLGQAVGEGNENKMNIEVIYASVPYDNGSYEHLPLRIVTVE